MDRSTSSVSWAQATIDPVQTLTYPECDWRLGSYQYPGATVRVLPAASGPGHWLEDTLAVHGSMLHEIRRRFEFLRNTRTRLYRQHDGDNIDLAAKYMPFVFRPHRYALLNRPELLPGVLLDWLRACWHEHR